jgi:tight adherence protein B
MTSLGSVVLVPAACALAGVVLVMPGRPRRVRVGGSREGPGRHGDDDAAPAALVPVLLPALALVAVVAWLVPSVLSPRWIALAAIASGTGHAVRRRSRAAAATREAAVRRQRVVDFAEALCGELAAGQPVATAVDRAVVVWPDAASVARAARLGADVPDALRELARSPGAEGVARLAAAWQLSASSGAGLAQASRRVLETARSRQATERLVRSEVASARATARLVCGLPVVVLLAAQGAGARPWWFLTAHPAGLVCLAAGLALSLTGLAWIDRIAASAVDGGG